MRFVKWNHVSVSRVEANASKSEVLQVIEQRETNLMSRALLFHYIMLNIFRMLIHPSSGTCDLFVELFHGLYCSGSMRVGVTLWFGWGGVVSGCRLKLASGYHTTHIEPEQYNSWNNSTNKSQAPEEGCITFETCWTLNNEIKKQVISSWSLFIQLARWCRSNKHKILQVSFVYFKREAEIVWKLVAIFLLRKFLWIRRNKRKRYLK